MRRATLLVVTALAAGCTNQLAERQAYLSQFIGQPEGVLVQQMGVPARSIETGGVRYLAYEDRRIDIVPSGPTLAPYYLGWYGASFPPQVIEWKCETTFEVAAGTVRSFMLRGNACG